MTTKEQQIWQKITQNLRSRIPENEFDLWFQDSALESYHTDKALIRVPNKYISLWLQEKYLSEICDSFKAVSKEIPEINFIYDAHEIRPETTGVKPFKTVPFLDKYDFISLMSFDHFLTSTSNHFAFVSAKELAQAIKNPVNPYNPFYLACASSSGKTHLLNAIGLAITQQHPELKVYYFSAETFKNHFRTFSKDKMQWAEFRNVLSQLDVFLFDDIHLLANQKGVQEEFLSIFNSLFGAKKQIVVTGNDLPGSLRDVEEKIRSRLGWGLISEIQVPDLNLKIRFIKKRTKEINLDLPEDVMLYLAHTQAKIGNLLKSINKLEILKSLKNEKITISMAKAMISENSLKGSDDIKKIISNYYNISVKELISDNKKRIYSLPRQIAMYLTRRYLHLPFHEIGYIYGNKDHSTVVYAIQKIEKIKELNKGISEDLKKLDNLIN